MKAIEKAAVEAEKERAAAEEKREYEEITHVAQLKAAERQMPLW